MVKSKSSYKETFLYCNLLILGGLIVLYYYLNKPIEEGIRNMNCCGGVEAGVHYSETDTEPPHYIRKCFKSSKDGSYEWSGFPCTGKGDSKCCPYSKDNGDKSGKGGKSGKEDMSGECIPTTKGGYCSGSEGNFVFRRGESKRYIKHGSDELLDINDANDMKDYFYDRGEKEKEKGTSVEMQRFLSRRGKNEKYMEQHLRDKRKLDQSDIASSKEKLKEQSKKVEIISSITVIHLLFLVVFSIVIRGEIIQRIDGFYDLLYMQYLSFTGKSV